MPGPPPLLTLPLPLHLGDLHAVEQLLVVLLAFGPFVVLGVVVAVLRRRDLAEADGAAEAAPRPQDRREDRRAERRGGQRER